MVGKMWLKSWPRNLEKMGVKDRKREEFMASKVDLPKQQATTPSNMTPIGPTPPGTPAGWSWSSISPYLAPAKGSLWERCWTWIRGVMDWVWKKLFPGPKDPLEAFIATFKGPIKEEAINFYLRNAHYIGRDAKHQFGKTIRLISKEPLKVHPLDYYCDVEASNEPVNARFQELPSSLFFQARFGNRAAFVQNKTLHVLTLNPTLDRRGKWISFDDCLATAALEAKDSEVVFRYDEDVTENFYLWHKGVPNIYLSSATKRLVVGTRGIMPLNFDALNPLPSHTNARVLQCKNNHKGIYLMLEACGKPSIDVLLDGKRLMDLFRN
jgi:hypothetical protein